MHDWEEERERFCLAAKDASGRRLEDHIEAARLHCYSVARDAEQRTLLHVMCRWSFEPGAIETIAEILTAGGDPNATDAAQRTALHVICFEEDATPGYAQERIEIIDLLLRSGAQIDVQDRHGRTPLFESLQFTRLDPSEYGEGEEYEPPASDVTKHLLLRGAGIDIQDSDGVAPLHLAVAHDDLAAARLLLGHGASAWLKTTRATKISLGNHSALDVPCGSRPSDLLQSEKMRALFEENRVRGERGDE